MTLLTLELSKISQGDYSDNIKGEYGKGTLTGVAETVAYELKQNMPLAVSRLEECSFRAQ